MREKLQLRKSNADNVPSFNPKKLTAYPKIPLGHIPMEVVTKSGKVINFK